MPDDNNVHMKLPIVQNDASVWPGHVGDRISCEEGDRVVIELLFDHVWKWNRAELLVASRTARRLESEAQERGKE